MRWSGRADAADAVPVNGVPLPAGMPWLPAELEAAIERTRARLPDQPDDFFLNPDHIADEVVHLAEQPPSAWTFELDLRPYAEKW